MISRRNLITGLVSLVAAPAIVRAGSLMPVKAVLIDPNNLTSMQITLLEWTRYEIDELVQVKMMFIDDEARLRVVARLAGYNQTSIT